MKWNGWCFRQRGWELQVIWESLRQRREDGSAGNEDGQKTGNLKERYQAAADAGKPGKEDNLNLSKIQMISIFPEGISSAAKMLRQLVITST